jgi:hypothetical protein
MSRRKPSQLPGRRTAGSPLARIPRIIYNDDSDILRMVPPPHTVESVAAALDYLKGTQVDCLCWCVGEQIAYAWPSKVIENSYDLRAKAAARGISGNWQNERDIMDSLHRQGIDYLPHLIQRAHAQDLMFVASFRMNDTHIKSYPDHLWASTFWKEHQHYRIWDATEGKSYYNAALDYSFPEVRNRYRDAVAEVVGMYDVDGIELDFTRSPYFFQPFEAWDKRAILTGFVHEIGAVLEQRGKARGRPLTLIARVACADRALTTAGLDLATWIERRLVHAVVISGLSNDYNQDIGTWRALCQSAGVRLYPAVEKTPAFNNADFYTPLIRNPLAPRHDGSGGVRFTVEEDIRMQRGMAQNLLAQQPDGIAMFNFPCLITEGPNYMLNDPATFRRVTALLSEMGDLRTLARKDKQYTFYRDLPIYVEANRPRRFHQTVPFAIRGHDTVDATVTLRWRWIAERNPHADGKFRQNPIVKPGLIRVYLNDREIPEAHLKKTEAPAGWIPSAFLLKRHQIVEVQVAGCELRNGANTLAFEMPEFPKARDPYVYVYELAAEVTFAERRPG